MTWRENSGDGQEGCGFLDAIEVGALLEGSLSDDRRVRFETHARSGCSRCAMLLADADAFAEALRDGPSEKELPGVEADRLAVRAWISQQRAQSPASSTWWRGLAAAAAVLVVASLLVLRLGGGPGGITVSLADGSTYQVDTMSFSPPPVVRGEPDERGAWLAAQRSYEAGFFEEAAFQLDGIAQRTGDSSAYLYLGIARLAAAQDELALSALDSAQSAAIGDDLPDGAIRWYRAVALLRLDRTDEAHEMLDLLAQSDLAYADQARELLSRLPAEAGRK